ncbi:hypothetical protein OS493_004376 [Desmophyllum pertusum]|uniref:RWD domain-containing protein n=1 Tax=Desmophyllum pertusum TaxID=174260 RepID=A0A9W9ZT30_9CNID|nr:hypothetical protein OS493_004376 [Desmophyllum pertusum]
MDHGDGSYSLEEEFELLEAIYIHELTIEGPRERPFAVSVLLHPSTGDEEDKRFVCLTLVIDLPEKYPSELPSIHIKTPRGLSEAHIESILANLRELAESCLGRPMLYELIEESFFDHYERGLTEVRLVDGFRKDKDEALKKVAEAEERVKEADNEKERSTTKLLNLRKNAAKLLRFIQEDPNECTISADDVSDRVDEMMETIAQQAEERL